MSNVYVSNFLSSEISLAARTFATPTHRGKQKKRLNGEKKPEGKIPYARITEMVVTIGAETGFWVCKNPRHCLVVDFHVSSCLVSSTVLRCWPRRILKSFFSENFHGQWKSWIIFLIFSYILFFLLIVVTFVYFFIFLNC